MICDISINKISTFLFQLHKIALNQNNQAFAKLFTVLIAALLKKHKVARPRQVALHHLNKSCAYS